MKKLLSALLLFSTVLQIAAAKLVYIEEQNFMLNIPEQWEALQVDDKKVIITDPYEDAFFLTRKYKEKADNETSEFYRFVMSELNADGDSIEFYYKNRKTIFSTINFQDGEFDYTGYGIFFIKDDAAVSILGFSTVDYFQFYNEFLLSIMDSYSETDVDLQNPGPVSSFLTETQESSMIKYELEINDKEIQFMFFPVLAESSQIIADREMKILAAYATEEIPIQVWNDAWTRCYRMIYRDAFQQTEQLYIQLTPQVISPDMPREEIAEILLKWLQSFTYSRTNTFTDFLNPSACIVNNEGDCDSLALIYIMLLRRYNIDTVLFVSKEFSHAMGGAAIDIEGASMIHDGIRYYVAELTVDVKLGLIDSGFSDSDAWLAIDFY